MAQDYIEIKGMEQEKILLEEGLKNLNIMKAGFYNYPLGDVDEKLSEAERLMGDILHTINNALHTWYMKPKD